MRIEDPLGIECGLELTLDHHQGLGGPLENARRLVRCTEQRRMTSLLLRPCAQASCIGLSARFQPPQGRAPLEQLRSAEIVKRRSRADGQPPKRRVALATGEERVSLLAQRRPERLCLRKRAPTDVAQCRADSAFGTGKPGMEEPVAITGRREGQRSAAPFVHPADRLVGGEFEHARGLEFG